MNIKEYQKNHNVGNTPLVELVHIEALFNLKNKIFAKLESFNPAGSVKDRVAISMILDAEEKGELKKGSVIIEPTSGNTGIGLAFFTKKLGYRCILTMPDTMSIERRQLLASYGAELVLTDGKLGMKGAIAKAEELEKEIPNSKIMGQFVNPANVQAHYLTTGPEIYEQSNHNVDVFVSAVGTGGTITGVGKYLKEQNPNIQIVAVEPESSPVLSKGVAGPHKIQGIGAGFVPKILDLTLLDKILTVSNEEAFEYGKLLIKEENLSIGISSGAAFKIALDLAKEGEGKNIVVILADGKDRYLSSDLYK